MESPLHVADGTTQAMLGGRRKKKQHALPGGVDGFWASSRAPQEDLAESVTQTLWAAQHALNFQGDDDGANVRVVGQALIAGLDDASLHDNLGTTRQEGQIHRASQRLDLRRKGESRCSQEGKEQDQPPRKVAPPAQTRRWIERSIRFRGSLHCPCNAYSMSCRGW